jgi:Na+-translocating ferredoxin:NAD+ oxidoreductase RNF subunit RnfB
MIDPAKCNGCHACVRGCSVVAIMGEVKKTHTLDKTKCVKCGACIEACKQEAIHKVRRSYAA